MPLYSYKGYDNKGQAAKGSLQADSLKSAKIQLKKKGVYVTELKDSTKKPAKKGIHLTGGKVDIQDLALATRLLSSLIKAGIPLVESVGAVADQMEHPVLKESLSHIRSFIKEGGSFHEGLLKYPNIFDTIYVSMCQAGEASGSLDKILLQLAEFTESQNELRSKVKSAMMYPTLMGIACTLILGGIFVYVVPKMMAVFESFPELTLEWYTLLVINISGFMVNSWYFLVAGAFGIYFIFKNWKKTEKGKATWDRILLDLPVFGKLNRVVAVSRFTRTLSTLLSGGVDMIQALDISKNVVDNRMLTEAIVEARENISEGESIAGPLRRSGQFPPLVIHMVEVGEKTGDLAHMLVHVSDSYDFQVKNTVNGLTSLLGPAMIVIMGGVIGFIVFSVLVPMFEISSLGG